MPDSKCCTADVLCSSQCHLLRRDVDAFLRHSRWVDRDPIACIVEIEWLPLVYFVDTCKPCRRGRRWRSFPRLDRGSNSWTTSFPCWWSIWFSWVYLPAWNIDSFGSVRYALAVDSSCKCRSVRTSRRRSEEGYRSTSTVNNDRWIVLSDWRERTDVAMRWESLWVRQISVHCQWDRGSVNSATETRVSRWFEFDSRRDWSRRDWSTENERSSTGRSSDDSIAIEWSVNTDWSGWPRASPRNRSNSSRDQSMSRRSSCSAWSCRCSSENCSSISIRSSQWDRRWASDESASDRNNRDRPISSGYPDSVRWGHCHWHLTDVNLTKTLRRISDSFEKDSETVRWIADHQSPEDRSDWWVSTVDCRCNRWSMKVSTDTADVRWDRGCRCKSSNGD